MKTTTTQRGIGMTPRSLMVGLAAYLAVLTTGFGTENIATWHKSIQIQFAGYTPPGGAATLTNFPALVQFAEGSNGFHYADMGAPANGADLRFTSDSNGVNALNYEIDSWTNGGTSFVWVQVPQLVDANTTIWAWYGKSGVAAPACTTNGATWKPVYQGVWHFQNNGSSIAVTNSVSGVGGTNNLGKSVATNGVVDGGAGCYDSASGLGSPDEVALRATKTLTLSAWIYPTDTGQNSIINKRGTGEYNYSLWAKPNGANFFQCNNGTGSATDTGPAYNLNEWFMLSVIVNENLSSGKLTFMGNGSVRSQSATYPGGMAVSSDFMSFGSCYTLGDNHQLKGNIDEVRVSTNVLSTNWIWAVYQNMASNRVFQSYGSAQEADKGLNVLGTNGVLIDLGEAASVPKGTDYGTNTYGSPVARTFTITNNSAIDTLYLTGNPAIAFGGANPGDFSTNGTAVATNLAPGASTTFQVVFNPQQPNLSRTATVTITNSDSNHNPYTFFLAGYGYQAGLPAISVLGTNGGTIANGASADPTVGTDFGLVITNTSSDHLFGVTNSGGATLTLTGATVVAISGANAGDFFTNGTAVATNIAAGAGSTFQIRFVPTGLGVRTALVTIANNVSGFNPYTFSLRGTGINGAGMNVLGTNGAAIANGEQQASAPKGTDFGTLVTNTTADHLFTVNSTGGGTLQLTGATVVAISGNTLDFFTNGTAVATRIGSGGSSTFQIRFQPTVMGVRTALVTIANDTTNANPYTFALRGTGDSGANMAVLGTNGAIVASGAAADFGTNFTVGGAAVANTFTITNSGVRNLVLSGSPRVSLSGDTAAFTLTADATTPVAPGGGTTTFTIQFNPSVGGPHRALVSIANNTLNTSPYTFTVQAGVPVAGGPAGVLYVHPYATLTPENGSDWLHAYRTLTNALVKGTGTFWVAGSYSVPATAELGTNTLYAGFQGVETNLNQRNWTLYPTVVDGGMSNSAFKSTVAGSRTLDGFTVVNCTNASGGGALTVGNAGNMNVYNCVFTNNWNGDDSGGGAIQQTSPAILTVSNSTFIGNVAGQGKTGEGGAVDFSAYASGTGVFWNCAFIGNSSSIRRGGAINVGNSQAGGRVYCWIVNCTFLTNNAGGTWAGGAINSEFGKASLNVTNCIFWGNRGGPQTIGMTAGDTLNLAYCDIDTNTASVSGGTITYGAGITNTNPLFVSEVAPYDLHLKSKYGHWHNGGWVYDLVTSPLIDAGDPASDYSREPHNSTGIELGFYGNTPQASKSFTPGGTTVFFH